MLASILMFIGVSSAVLSFLDWALDDSTKAAISDKAMQAWNYLDELKRVSFIGWLQKKAVRIPFTLALTLLLFLFYAWCTKKLIEGKTFDLSSVDIPRLTKFLVALLIAYSIAGGVVGYLMLAFTLKRRSHSQVLVCCGVFIALSAIVGFANYMISHELARLTNEGLLTGVFAFVNLAWSLLSIGTFYTTVIVAVPIALLYLAGFIIFSAEVVMRRVAESPKGPILGVSAVVTGFGVLLKAFA